MAKKPKRAGSASRMEAADSLTWRARVAAASAPCAMVHPGAVRERMLVRMLSDDMISRLDSRVQVGSFQPDGSPPLRRNAVGLGG